MSEVTISLRVDKEIHQEMKDHNHINWSAVLRNSIANTLENLDKINTVRAEAAGKTIDTLRSAKLFTKGKKSVEVIREWREKRRFKSTA